MTAAELRRDLADCERQATGPGPFRFNALSEDYETARDRIARERGRCMEERGWQPLRKDGAARWCSVPSRRDLADEYREAHRLDLDLAASPVSQ
jgi:hypothetical protein